MNFPRRIDHAIRPAAAAAAQERQEESPDESITDSINPGGQAESITQAGSSARDLQSDLPVSQEHTEAPRNTPGAHQERTEATRSDQERQERSPDGSITGSSIHHPPDGSMTRSSIHHRSHQPWPENTNRTNENSQIKH